MKYLASMFLREATDCCARQRYLFLSRRRTHECAHRNRKPGRTYNLYGWQIWFTPSCTGHSFWL